MSCLLALFPRFHTTKIAHGTADGPAPHETGNFSIQFMSDLHLEKEGYQNFRIPCVEPTLILAGDVGNLKDREYIAFLGELCRRFDRVLLIPGNHEYFHMDRCRARETLAPLNEKLVWMDTVRVDLDDGRIIVLGCTLHSHIDRAARKVVQKMIQGFSYIGNWSIKQHNAEHKKDRKWLQQQLAEISRSSPSSRVIIATHFPPKWGTTSDIRYENEPTRSYFGSETPEELGRWRGSDQITHWIYGHTHLNSEFVHGATTILSNQRHCGDACEIKFDITATI